MNAKKVTTALRMFLLNPRSWYPVSEVAGLLGVKTDKFVAGLDREGTRITDGVQQVDHTLAIWRVCDHFGGAVIEDALGDDAASVLPDGRRTQTVTIRLPQWLLDNAADTPGRDLGHRIAMLFETGTNNEPPPYTVRDLELARQVEADELNALRRKFYEDREPCTVATLSQLADIGLGEITAADGTPLHHSTLIPFDIADQWLRTNESVKTIGKRDKEEKPCLAT